LNESSLGKGDLTKSAGKTPLEKYLTPADMVTLLELIQDCVLCQSMSSLMHMEKQLHNIIGSSQITFCVHTDIALREDHGVDLINFGFPCQFIEILQKEKLWENNPIFLMAMQQVGLLFWQDAYTIKEPSQLWEELTLDLGLHESYTFSPFLPQMFKSHTMAAIGDLKKNEEERCRLILKHVMPHLHWAMVAAVKSESKPNSLSAPLTRRELEVLKWLQNGKTSWEISIILKVSERTINFHAQNIKKKLDVSSRSAAVAQALRLNILELG
jgi:LuxR family transcriptional regulator, quorum-sensing system regulator CviR